MYCDCEGPGSYWEMAPWRGHVLLLLVWRSEFISISLLSVMAMVVMVVVAAAAIVAVRELDGTVPIVVVIMAGTMTLM